MYQIILRICKRKCNVKIMQSKKTQKNKNKTKNKTKKADTFFSEIFSKNLFQFQCSVLVERVL